MSTNKNHGGRRPGAGRKKKSDELEMIEALGKHVKNEDVFRALKKLIAAGNTKAIAIYMNYMYGKPVDRQDIQAENTNIDLSVNKTYEKPSDDPKSKDDDNDDLLGNNLKIV